MMWIVFGIFILVLLWAISMYNSIVHAQQKVEEARSGIDVALSKRYSLLTNMQESVKGYMKHESDLLIKCTQLRNSMNIQELSGVAEEYIAQTQRLLMIAESYPDLKASDLFRNFQDAIVDSEEHLQAARRFYNSNVTLFNEKLVMFPSNIIAGWMSKEPYGFFMADADEKKMIQVEF